MAIANGDRNATQRPGAKEPSGTAARSRKAIPMNSTALTSGMPKSSVVPQLEPNSIVTRDGAFIDPFDRLAMIAEAAYFHAQRRGFDPGHDVEDWLTAEAEIDAALAAGKSPTVLID